VLGVTEAATVKVPLKGTPPSASADLDARPTIIAAIINSPKQIKISGLLEIEFLDIVISSVN
jgi:hypothetical protein